MKKAIKSSLIFMVLAIILLSLTGCGGNKLVATKTTSGDDSLFGSYTEKIEVSFKKDKADKIVWTMEFDDEKTANSMVGMFKLAQSELEGLEIKQDGKKVVLTMGSKAFSKQSDLKEEDLSRENIKKSLEEEGYTVK